MKGLLLEQAKELFRWDTGANMTGCSSHYHQWPLSEKGGGSNP